MKDSSKEFREEVLNSVQNRGKGDVADAIGMPDEKDYETLLRIIQRYERTHPGELSFVVKTARDEFKAGIYGKRLTWDGGAIISKEMNVHYRFELPVGLGRVIEEVFPSMFRSKKHLHWFIKNFPALTITGENK